MKKIPKEKVSASYYAVIPARVRYDKNLSSSEKLLYGEITALCNDKGYSWADNFYYAGLYGVNTRTINRWIENLIDKGYIVREYEYRPGTNEKIGRRLYLPESLPQIFTPKSAIDPRTKMSDPRTKMSSPPDKNVRSLNNILKDNIEDSLDNTKNVLSKHTSLVAKKNAKSKKIEANCQIVFDHWKTELLKIRSILNPSKFRKIKARLEEGWTVDELKLVITGVKISDYHMGRDTGVAYNSIETIYRDSSQVEKFLEIASQPKSLKINTKDSPSHRVVTDNFSSCRLCAADNGKPCPVHSTREAKNKEKAA